jgi:ABC-2 type transport system permease protein
MNSLRVSTASSSLWSSVWKLLRLRVKILLSGFKRATTRRKIGMVVLGIVILPALVFFVWLSWTLLDFLRSPELAATVGDVSQIWQNVPVLVVYATFLGVLLTSFGVLLQALYLAGDMDFLLTSPLPIRAVFIAKLMQAVLPNFALVCLFGLPVMFGLGASGEFHFIYYPMVVLVLAAMALAAAGISSLLVMLVVHIFPVRRVAEVLGFIGAVMTFLCSQSGQLANMSDVSADQASQVFTTLSKFNTLWSPLAWAGRGLVDIGQGIWLTGFGYLSLTFILSILIFGLALEASERLYYSGWAGMQQRSRKKSKRRKSETTNDNKTRKTPGINLIPTEIRSIIMKDWLVMRRDLRNMSQLVTPLILGVVYAIMLLRNGNDFSNMEGDAPLLMQEALSNASVYFNVGIALFVGWILLARLAGMGFSQEGRSYWVLKTAPLSSLKLISAKFLAAYLPALILCWGFLLVTWALRGAGVNVLLYSLPVIGLTLAGNTGINLAFGISGANLDWEDPRQMQKGFSGCLSSLLTAIYLPVILGLFYMPVLLAVVFSLPELLGQVIGLVLGGAVSLVCAAIPPWLVREKVTTLGE